MHYILHKNTIDSSKMLVLCLHEWLELYCRKGTWSHLIFMNVFMNDVSELVTHFIQ